ncbi:hypothetical protein RUM43_000195 [Polyplax serrata]|uniref:Uncharacterized protein n=1 Tax=Polyplax serrata TaxID=468196 RepID=A0AAN8XNM5_POLSC
MAFLSDAWKTTTFNESFWRRAQERAGKVTETAGSSDSEKERRKDEEEPADLGFLKGRGGTRTTARQMLRGISGVCETRGSVDAAALSGWENQRKRIGSNERAREREKRNACNYGRQKERERERETVRVRRMGAMRGTKRRTLADRVKKRGRERICLSLFLSLTRPPCTHGEITTGPFLLSFAISRLCTKASLIFNRKLATDRPTAADVSLIRKHSPRAR